MSIPNFRAATSGGFLGNIGEDIVIGDGYVDTDVKSHERSVDIASFEAQEGYKSSINTVTDALPVISASNTQR